MVLSRSLGPFFSCSAAIRAAERSISSSSICDVLEDTVSSSSGRLTSVSFLTCSRIGSVGSGATEAKASDFFCFRWARFGLGTSSSRPDGTCGSSIAAISSSGFNASTSSGRFFFPLDVRFSIADCLSISIHDLREVDESSTALSDLEKASPLDKRLSSFRSSTRVCSCSDWTGASSLVCSS